MLTHEGFFYKISLSITLVLSPVVIGQPYYLHLIFSLNGLCQVLTVFSLRFKPKATSLLRFPLARSLRTSTSRVESFLKNLRGF